MIVLEYILLIQGQNENDYTIGRLVVLQIENLLTAYKERFDKENFVKNLLILLKPKQAVTIAAKLNQSILSLKFSVIK